MCNYLSAYHYLTTIVYTYLNMQAAYTHVLQFSTNRYLNKTRTTQANSQTQSVIHEVVCMCTETPFYSSYFVFN